MNYNRITAFQKHFLFAIAASLLYLVLSSCSKEQYDSGYLSRRHEIAWNAINSYKSKGLFIHDIIIKGERIECYFSDNSSFWFYTDSINVATLGIDGQWYMNGVRTDFVSESVKGKVLLFEHLKSKIGYSDLIGIEEGYTDWKFIFNNNDSISITKSLFSYDPDEIKRGINHRGYSITVPENTLPAFRMSRLQGFKYVETDVRFTSDGVAVLLHDNKVDRVSNGKGDISSMTFEQARQLDFGSWKSAEFKGVTIPSFEEFIELCSKIGLEPVIELKTGTRSQIHSIVDIVSHYGLQDNTSYISFSYNLLSYVLEKAPDARVGFLCNKVTGEAVDLALTLRNNSNYVYIGASDYSDQAIVLCRNSKFALDVWTIDSETQIRSLPDYISGVTSNCLHAGRVIHDSRRSQ